jgi:hypothetical protein
MDEVDELMDSLRAILHKHELGESVDMVRDRLLILVTRYAIMEKVGYSREECLSTAARACLRDI